MIAKGVVEVCNPCLDLLGSILESHDLGGEIEGGEGERELRRGPYGGENRRNDA